MSPPAGLVALVEDSDDVDVERVESLERELVEVTRMVAARVFQVAELETALAGEVHRRELVEDDCRRLRNRVSELVGAGDAMAEVLGSHESAGGWRETR